jgi:hypothetical protein
VLHADKLKGQILQLANNTCALVIQSLALVKQKRLYFAFKRYAEATNQETLVELLNRVYSLAVQVKYLVPFIPTMLGKLGIKEEPGKVRVFAMVD